MLACVVGHVYGVEDLLGVDALAGLSHRGERRGEVVGVAARACEFADRVFEGVPACLRQRHSVLSARRPRCRSLPLDLSVLRPSPEATYPILRPVGRHRRGAAPRGCERSTRRIGFAHMRRPSLRDHAPSARSSPVRLYASVVAALGLALRSVGPVARSPVVSSDRARATNVERKERECARLTRTRAEITAR